MDYRTKEWDPDFQTFLNGLKKKKHTILTGDLNVCHQEMDIANAKGNKRSAGFTNEEREMFTKFLEQGWVDSFRRLHPTEVKYSYFSAKGTARADNKGWRLDYFIVDQEGMKGIESSDINTEIYGSDHVPVEIVLNLAKLD